MGGNAGVVGEVGLVQVSIEELSLLRATRGTLVQRIGALQHELNSANEALERERQKNEGLKGKVNFDHLSRATALQKEVERLIGALHAKEAEMAKLQSDLRDLEDKQAQNLAKLREEIDEKQEELDSAGITLNIAVRQSDQSIKGLERAIKRIENLNWSVRVSTFVAGVAIVFGVWFYFTDDARLDAKYSGVVTTSSQVKEEYSKALVQTSLIQQYLSDSEKALSGLKKELAQKEKDVQEMLVDVVSDKRAYFADKKSLAIIEESKFDPEIGEAEARFVRTLLLSTFHTAVTPVLVKVLNAQPKTGNLLTSDGYMMTAEYFLHEGKERRRLDQCLNDCGSELLELFSVVGPFEVKLRFVLPAEFDNAQIKSVYLEGTLVFEKEIIEGSKNEEAPWRFRMIFIQ